MNAITSVRNAKSLAPAAVAVALLGLSLAVRPAFAGDESPAPTKESLQAMYSEFLKAEGFNPEVDKDGDVAFKREGRVYFIDVGGAQKDPQYFRMALPNIWPIESEQERAKVLAAVDYANMRTKVCKTHTVGNNVWVAVEVFVAKPSDFKAIFGRSLNAIDGSTAVFVKKMRE